MNQGVSGCREKSITVFVAADGRVSVRLPNRLNPYAMAVGKPLADVPGIVGAQFVAYPNPHLICSLRLCERATRTFVPVEAERARDSALEAIAAREYGLHLIACLKSGMFGGIQGETEKVQFAAVEVVRFARSVERAISGDRFSSRLLFGGVGQTDPEELQAVRLMSVSATRHADEMVRWFSIRPNRPKYDVLGDEAVRLAALVRRLASALENGRDRNIVAPVGIAIAGEHAESVNAPRGRLTHVIAVGEVGYLLSGRATIPTYRNLPTLEANLTYILKLNHANSERSALEQELTDVIRMYNPCGVDVSGDFAEFIWE